MRELLFYGGLAQVVDCSCLPDFKAYIDFMKRFYFSAQVSGIDIRYFLINFPFP